MGKQREVSYEEAETFAKDNGLIYLEVSAKTGQNVEEAFLRTARKIYENIQSGALDLNAAESGVCVCVCVCVCSCACMSYMQKFACPFPTYTWNDMIFSPFFPPTGTCA
jgi:hypothetical protein